MSYWDDFDDDELIMIKELLVSHVQDLEIQLNTFSCIIDDIDFSIEGRKV